MKVCDCNKFKVNIPKIDSVTMSAWVHGVYWTAEIFEYCPWCGKELTEEEPIRLDFNPT